MNRELELLEQAQRENAALKKLLDRANERMDDLKSGAPSQQAEQSGLVEELYHLSDVWAINADEHKEYGRFDEAEVLRRASRELRNALSATPSPETDK